MGTANNAEIKTLMNNKYHETDNKEPDINLSLEVVLRIVFCALWVWLYVEEHKDTVEVRSLVSTNFQPSLQPTNLGQHHPGVLESNFYLHTLR